MRTFAAFDLVEGELIDDEPLEASVVADALKQAMVGLSEASDVLGKWPDDALNATVRVWLFRDTIIEADIDFDDNARMKEFVVTPTSEWKPGVLETRGKFKS